MTRRKKKEEYGYEPLDPSGNDYAAMAGMSALDQAAYRANAEGYGKAQAAGDRNAMELLHNSQEKLRRRYGYSGGPDGSMYIPTQQFRTEKAPSYVSRYQKQIDSLMNNILNRPEFQYDPASDPLYQSYEKQYTRKGQQAMQDTMGQVAARTGGLASSYAGSAAQQSYNRYMDALSDKIPELQQLAYNMYLGEGRAMRDDLNMLRSAEQGDYGRYLDQLNQHNRDQSFAYGQYRDEVGDERYQAEQDYRRGRDSLSDQRYDQEWQYRLDRDKIEDARYQDELNYARKQDAMNLAAKHTGGGRRSGGGGSSRGVADGGGQDYDGLFMAAAASGHPKSFITNNYKRFGFTSSSGLFDDFSEWDENGGGEVDIGSVLALGYGPISNNELADLEEAGEVVSYVEGGKIKFKRAQPIDPLYGYARSGLLSMPGGQLAKFATKFSR